MPITNSPLRYPGGKSQLAPLVIELLRANDLFNGVYVEPFAGGAGIAWKLLLDGYVSEVWINDIDRSIHALWASVLRHADDLCERIETTHITIEEWHKQRAIQQESRPKQLDLAFSTFFLNRTNRSGILKAGVIGGLTQQGNYSLDCRFNKVDLISRIQRIALYREQVKLSRKDAAVFITESVSRLPKQSLVNIDPPYYGKGRELYCSFYDHADHASLAKRIREIDQPWMLTYDDVPEIRALYEGLRVEQSALNYSAQVKRVGIELLILGPTLALPKQLMAA